MFLIQEIDDKYRIITPGTNEIVEYLSDSVTKVLLPLIDVKEIIPKVTALAFSSNYEYVAVFINTKQLVVYNSKFETVKSVVVERVPTKICFTHSNDLLLAFGTGYVYLHKLTDDKPQEILGHTSVVIDLIVTPCGNYVITSDRDEKIRVSQFPNAYNIVTYCLGHTEFVNCLAVLESPVLFSGSGDGTVRVWNYLTGKQLNLIDTSQLASNEELEKLKLEVEDAEVLPINDIKLSQSLLAVSLHGVSKLFLYKIEVDYQISLIHTLELTIDNFQFQLLNRLYLIEANKLSIYSMKNMEIVANHLVTNTFQSKDIQQFYKKKFDNMQDYLERKKRRLEAK